MTVRAPDRPLAASPSPWWRQVRTSRVLQSATALILVQLAYRAWATYGAWFHLDDFNFVSRMLHNGTSPVSAFQPYFGHVMPAAMYLSWLNNHMAPWQWWLPATELLAMQTLANLGLLILLINLFGARIGVLPPLTLFLFAASSVPSSIWWAAAVNALPLLVSLFFALSAHVTYLRAPLLRHALAANLWVVAGIAFNEKAVLVYGALGVFTLCYFTAGGPWARLTQAIRDYRSAVAVYAVTAAVYVTLYIHLGLDLHYGQRTGYPFIDVTKNMVFRAFLPSLFGGPLSWLRLPDQSNSFPQPGDLVVFASLIAAGLLVRELRLTRTGWLRAAWLPVFFLAIDVALVVLGRASFVGPLISLDYRFQGELAGVTAIAVGCAVLPIIGATHQVTVQVRSEFFERPRRVAIVCLAVALLGVYSSSQFVAHWQADHGAQRYFDRVLPTLRATRTPIPLIDAPVPATVTHGFFYPQNALSRIFRGYDFATRFPAVTTDNLYMVDDSGAIRPALVPPTRSAPPGPKKECGYRLTRDNVTIPLTGPLFYGGWWVRLGYIASADSPVQVSVGGKTYETNVRQGLHSLYLKAGADEFDSITLSGLEGDAFLCTDDVSVGRPYPATTGSP